MASPLDDKVTELAAGAVKNPDSWVTVIVLALWAWWMSYQLTVMTKKLQEEKLAASKAQLDALEEANRLKVTGLQKLVDEAAEKALVAEQAFQLVARNIDAKLAEAEASKARVAKLRSWEELDALAQGK